MLSVARLLDSFHPSLRETVTDLVSPQRLAMQFAFRKCLHTTYLPVRQVSSAEFVEYRAFPSFPRPMSHRRASETHEALSETASLTGILPRNNSLQSGADGPLPSLSRLNSGV
ncbi:hypothetical protein NW759_004603 [Fusarium solani]|nr:hypothetical protein NW759_004603 [Fusarium solani]